MNLQETRSLASEVVSKHQNWWSSGDRKDLEETAWFGIVELLSQDPEVTHRQLWDAAVKAVTKDFYQYKKIHYGGVEKSDKGAAVKYWTQNSPFADPESAVENLAVQQVLAAIKPRSREILTTLAEHDNNMQAAADALGISVNGLYGRLSEARQQFYVLWYDQETSGRKYQPKKYLRYVK